MSQLLSYCSCYLWPSTFSSHLFTTTQHKYHSISIYTHFQEDFGGDDNDEDVKALEEKMQAIEVA